MTQHDYHHYYCLLLAYCCFLFLSNWALADDNEWMESDLRQLYDQVYSNNSATLNPAKTIDLIKQMERYYAKSNDEHSVEKRQQLDDLIECSHVNTRRCDRQSFLLYRALIYSPQGQYPNVRAFLIHNQKALFDLCEKVIAFYLKDNVRDLTQEERASTMELSDSILAGDKHQIKQSNEMRPYFYTPMQTLVSGLVRYVEKKDSKSDLKVLDDEQLGRYYFHDQFMRLVGNVCLNVKRELNPTVEIYDMFMDERYTMKHKDRFTSQWLTNARLCREILENLDQIRDNVFVALLSKSQIQDVNKKHWYGPLVACFKTIHDYDDPAILA